MAYDNFCTKAEARGKECPLRGIQLALGLLFAKGGSPAEKEAADRVPSDGGMCVASRCMLWQWQEGGCGYCGFAPAPENPRGWGPRTR